MFGRKKIEAQVNLYKDGRATVKAQNVLDVTKMYHACRRVLESEGVNLDKVNELMYAVHLEGENDE